jgi:glycosyltransferase involved in cell wall biosynthesis
MFKAFEDIGFKTNIVSGFGHERKKSIQEIQKEYNQGQRFDFLYSESSTWPTLLTERHRIPTYPFLDFGFFKWLNGKKIPIGLYYRDIHWRFEQFKKNSSLFKQIILIPFFYYDLICYLNYVNHLFLPSLRMAAALPIAWPEERMSALPPGCHIVDTNGDHQKGQTGSLEIFYVGGILPPLYDLKTMLEVVQDLERVHLTICCREFEWRTIQSYYSPIDPSKVTIVHAYGEELKKFYARADIFGLYWENSSYLDFAMPVKVFEALGYGMPIIASAGNEAARFISQENIGWVASDPREFYQLLIYLRDHPQLIEEKRKWVKSVRERHTWTARAREVAEILKHY